MTISVEAYVMKYNKEGVKLEQQFYVGEILELFTHPLEDL